MAHSGRITDCVSQYIYEYRKGMRQLFLLTMSPDEGALLQKRLEKEQIDYYLQKVSTLKVNIFFGCGPCVKTAQSIVNKPLHQLTPEQDFILGMLLGYDRELQCVRFLSRTEDKQPHCPQNSVLH